jgi:hypothetical protein
MVSNAPSDDDEYYDRGVALELEHVELDARSDVDHRQAHPGVAVSQVGWRIEHVLVERAQPLGVVGQQRHMVDPGEEHVVHSAQPVRSSSPNRVRKRS